MSTINTARNHDKNREAKGYEQQICVGLPGLKVTSTQKRRDREAEKGKGGGGRNIFLTLKCIKSVFL